MPELFTDGVLATRLCCFAYVVIGAFAIGGAVLRSRRRQRARSSLENGSIERLAPAFVEASMAWSAPLARASDVATIGLALAWWRHGGDADALPWMPLAIAVSVATRLPVARLDRLRAQVLAGRASPTAVERLARDEIALSVALVAVTLVVRFDRWTRSAQTDHEFEPFAAIAIVTIARGIAGVVHGRWTHRAAGWLRA